MQIQLQALFSFGRKEGKAKKTDFSCLHWQPPPLFLPFSTFIFRKRLFSAFGVSPFESVEVNKNWQKFDFFRAASLHSNFKFSRQKVKAACARAVSYPFFHAGTPFFPGNELWQVVSFFKSIQNSFVGLKRALIDVSFEPALFLKSPTTPSASPRRGRTESFEAGIPDVF